jgi:hypothetical protein
MDKVDQIIDIYNKVIKGVETEALSSQKRAYGGIIRAEKGKLVEEISRLIVEASWEKLKQDKKRLSFPKKRFKIPIKRSYLKKLDPEIRDYIEQNIKDFYYSYKPDIAVFIDNNFSTAIECKAYTENAMLKRILVDFWLLKQLYPKINFVLIQLESQLGSDYSKLPYKPLGSPSTHTLLSYFDVDLKIITLLQGERDINKPIHKPEFFKPLTRESLNAAIKIMAGILKQWTNPSGK